MTKKKTDEEQRQPMTAGDLKQDEHNYRKHSETNKARIRKSIDEAGLGRSVVIDADGVLVAGNGVQSVVDPNTPVRMVETDGTELVVVKRTDLHTGDPRRKTLAFADNATGDDVEWDMEAIAEDWTEDEAGEWGVEWPKSAINNYSRKIEIPTYEPVEGVVELSELTDKTKYEQLCSEIEAAEIDGDIAEFLKMAATRHIVFDYARIGDYYANASPEVQDLMERSALVIIDFAKAVENGFVKLTQELTEMCEAQRMEESK